MQEKKNVKKNTNEKFQISDHQGFLSRIDFKSLINMREKG